MYKHFYLISLLTLCILNVSALASENQDTLDISTPFRKGRWMTGLSGSISSGSTNLDSIQKGVSRNQYAIDFATGKFIKDRLLVGVIFQIARTSTEEFVKRTSETLYIGPNVSFYFSDNEQGSLFIAGSAGYAKFRDDTGVQLNGVFNQIDIDGNGLGTILRFGYSYVIHDRISFDLGLNLTTFWINADRISQPANTTSKENFRVGDLSFSFGFNVLLDDFFF